MEKNEVFGKSRLNSSFPLLARHLTAGRRLPAGPRLLSALRSARPPPLGPASSPRAAPPAPARAGGVPRRSGDGTRWKRPRSGDETNRGGAETDRLRRRQVAAPRAHPMRHLELVRGGAAPRARPRQQRRGPTAAPQLIPGGGDEDRGREEAPGGWRMRWARGGGAHGRRTRRAESSAGGRRGSGEGRGRIASIFPRGELTTAYGRIKVCV